MGRNALPQNYIVHPGNILDDFETIGDYIAVSGGTLAANTTEYKTGTKSLKVTGNKGVTCTFDKIININCAADYKNMGIWMYFHSDPALTLSYLILYLGATTDMSKHFYRAVTANTNTLTMGWNWIPLYGVDWYNVGTDTWDSPRIRMRIAVTSKAEQQAIVSFDSFYTGVTYRPKAVIMFDDGHLTTYSEGFKYMETKGIKGTSYIGSTSMGVSVAQLTEMYNAGWAIGNHASEHIDLTGLTQAQIETKIQTCTDWLLANGFDRGAYHVAYPYGSQNAAVLAAMAACGMKTGRSVTSAYQRTPPSNRYILASKSIGDSAVTLTEAKECINTAIINGQSMFLLFHQLVAADPGASQWLISDFRALIDYLVERKVECVTIDEWYEGLTNPRYRSLPLSRATV
jgi:peptidoglycan/xylan/chitin deacetylase (PgdA/CDA1 family)